MKKFLISAFVLTAVLAAAVSVFSCGKRGEGEKAGEKIDEAVDGAKDAFKKDGPMENAGEKVDEALDDKK